jgi:hypothetical protein
MMTNSEMIASLWERIGTAPRDGSSVLLWGPDFQDGPNFGFWSMGAWCLRETFVDEESWNNAGGHQHVAPTHWFPLVPPFVAPGERGKG